MYVQLCTIGWWRLLSVRQTISSEGQLSHGLYFRHQLTAASFLWSVEDSGYLWFKVLYDAVTCV